MTPPDTSRAEAEAHEFVADWLGIFDSNIRASAMNKFEQALANKLLRAKAEGVREAFRLLESVNEPALQKHSLNALLESLATRLEKGEA